MDPIFYFVIFFLGAFVFFRLAIYLSSKPLTEIAAHTREGAKFHHLHYGVAILTLGILSVLLMDSLRFSASLLGFGLGMVVDEFIPSLYLPEPEPLTSSLYRKSFAKTLTIFLIVGLVVLALILYKNGGQKIFTLD